MTCKDFKDIFQDKIILAFVMDEHTNLYKFNSKHITFFMRKFIDEYRPDWRTIFFYEIDSLNVDVLEQGVIKKFNEKARFIYLYAKRKDQMGGLCAIKSTYQLPDFTHLEGKKARAVNLRFKD